MSNDSMPQVENSTATGRAPKRAIEEGFPIVEINRLAEPERNAFKPIYQMHKWFARRASCVFRAILLGALKPAGTDIMEEFYKDHTHDPDTNGKVILDPFMGGGTTVVEALRLGCKVIGIDLNPVAWFIVKTEVEPVDLDELRAAFDRLAARSTASGKPLREELLSHYKTECPACGNPDADIIYVFWVKSAICTDAKCHKQVPLFPNYLVAQKTPSIRYYGDVRCSNARCGKKFDWEIEPAALVGEARLMVASGLDGAGETRANRRWAYAPAPDSRAREARVPCPWCNHTVAPILSQKKTERKKVKLSVLHCPHCAEVWQYRGTPPETVTCPACRKEYAWEKGNVPDKGKFVCACGNRDKIIQSIRKLPADQLLPMRMYALEGYCARCAGGEDEEDAAENGHLWEGPSVVSDRRAVAAVSSPPTAAVAALYERRTTNDGKTGGPRLDGGRRRPPLQESSAGLKPGATLLRKNHGKFFKRVSVADEARYQQAGARWEKEKETLPYPKQEIPVGEKTKSGLLAHHYRYWHQMFNPRQLLCLATLLKAIDEEPDAAIKDTLASTFHTALERNNMFCRYFNDRNTIQGSFARQDYQPKNTPAENNLWADSTIRGSFPNLFGRTLLGKQFLEAPFDYKPASEERNTALSAEKVCGEVSLSCLDSRAIGHIGSACVDCVITDPPFGSNVNYAELGDFFYVWLGLLLARRFDVFLPEHTPKSAEIVVNPVRRQSVADFLAGLTAVFKECYRLLCPHGLLVFTFHHTQDETWEAVLRSILDAEFEVECIYPVVAEKETALTKIQATGTIAFDLIHVCRRRESGNNGMAQKRSWAGIRQEIRRRAREEIKLIEAGRYGRGLKGPDVNLILIGKCLELYSRHYGAVVVEENGVEKPFPLREALGEIRMLVDQLVSREKPLPSELEGIDRESYVYLTALCEKSEIKSDDVHKATRGIIEVDRLLEAGLMKCGRAKRGRTYEVYSPFERYKDLAEKFRDRQSAASATGSLFGEDANAPLDSKAFLVDKLHFLMGLAEAREDVGPWVSRWSGDLPQLRAAAEYLAKRQEKFAPVLKRVLGRMEVGPLLRGTS